MGFGYACKTGTRILTTVPTIVLCSQKLPVKFFLDRSTAICQESNGLFLCNQSTIIDPAKGWQKANLETLTEEESRTGTTSLLSEIREIILEYMMRINYHSGISGLQQPAVSGPVLLPGCIFPAGLPQNGTLQANSFGVRLYS